MPCYTVYFFVTYDARMLTRALQDTKTYHAKVYLSGAAKPSKTLFSFNHNESLQKVVNTVTSGNKILPYFDLLNLWFVLTLFLLN